MELYALVGGSGTGKSHGAVNLAYRMGIDAIIDDGLLIKDGKILAGHSAKRERSKLQAVHRAIFTDVNHQDEVREAVTQLNPGKLLVIGTSVKMIKRIIAALDLPEPTKVIRIEDISTEGDIKLAKKIRQREGKHTIPVATIEVKKRFSGLLVDPVEIFLRLRSQSPPQKIGEQSIVRPAFSYIGKLVISDKVISSLVEKALSAVDGFQRGHRIHVDIQEDGVTVELQAQLRYGEGLVDVALEGQKRIKEEIEYLTGLNVIAVNIVMKGLVV